jgi:hypothetical protein
MAKTKIPDPLHRRELLARELAAPRALAVAEAYLEEGRVVDAIDFLRKAQAGERLAELRRQAIESGDAFLLRAAASAQKEPPEMEEWQALEAAAEAAGKELYAAGARRQAAREED